MTYTLFTKSGKPFESLGLPTEVAKEIISWMEFGEMHFLDFNIPWADGNGYDRYIIPVVEVAGIILNARTRIEHQVH